MTVVDATLAHAGVLAALHGQCFDDGWDEKACAEVLAMPGCVARLALGDDEAPVGFVVLTANAGEAEIVTVGVVPDHRGHGVARALVEDAVDAAQGMGAARCVLEVAVDNTAALGLYGALGFAEVGRRKGYYRRADGRVDALILEKTF